MMHDMLSPLMSIVISESTFNTGSQSTDRVKKLNDHKHIGDVHRFEGLAGYI